MGVISDGMMAGLGKGMADFGKTMLLDTLENERNEAKFLREKALGISEREETQIFKTSEREAGQVFTAEQDKLKAKTDIKKARISASKGKSVTSGMTLAERQKAARKIISEVSAGNVEYADIKPYELEEFKRQTYLDYGLDSTGEKMVKKNALYQAQKEPPKPSTNDIAKASKWYDDTASALESDKSQFGMSETEIKAKKAQEFADERNKKGTGIIASARGDKEPEKQVAKPITEAQYRKMMQSKYSDIPDDVLEKKVAAARKAGRVQ